jgi:peptidyl-prolyl cis-trans isomerase SurA
LILQRSAAPKFLRVSDVTKFLAFRLISILLAAMPLALPVHSGAGDQKVLVTINDAPLTSYDVEQRINLWKLLGENHGSGEAARRFALDELIDDLAEVEEAKKFGANASDKEIEDRLGTVAKGLKTDLSGLRGKLKAQGITVGAMKQYLAAQIAFSRLINGKQKEKVSVSKAEVDSKLATYKAEIDGKVRKFMSDPRMQPVTVYELLEINFPIDGGADGISNELLQSRAIEANQYLQRFKGCKSARSAASGIFNVRVGKKIEADGAKLPKPLRAALNKTKVGSAIGPMRAANGLQILAFCGVRKIVPTKPKVAYPTRAQVESSLLNERYASVTGKYKGFWRKGLLIEYRDPAYGP